MCVCMCLSVCLCFAIRDVTAVVDWAVFVPVSVCLCPSVDVRLNDIRIIIMIMSIIVIIIIIISSKQGSPFLQFLHHGTKKLKVKIVRVVALKKEKQKN